jgi:hypothetical protein
MAESGAARTPRRPGVWSSGTGGQLGRAVTWVFLGLVVIAFGATEWRLRARGALPAAQGREVEAPRLETVAAPARYAAKRIATSPLLWLGVATSVVVAAVEGRPAYPRALIGGWTLPAAIGLFAAVYLTAGRRAETAVPAIGERTRTAGLLLGAAAAALALGLVSLTVVVALIGPMNVFGGWRAHPLELAQAATVPLVLASVAVATARWWPHPAVAPVVLVVLLFSPLTWELDLHHVTRDADWAPGGPGSLGTGELAWHLVFQVGLSVLAVGLALLRHHRRRPLIALTVAGAVALVLGQLAPGV